MDVSVHGTWLKKFLVLGRTRVLLEREDGALYIGDQSGRFVIQIISSGKYMVAFLYKLPS